MAKAKVKRASTSIDMTAMCDVSFLLLTFFVLTATAREDETLIVDSPASFSQEKLTGDNYGVITVGEGGKIFFGVKDPEIRRETLRNISREYSINFSEEEYQKFSEMADFGVPVRNLRQLLSLEADARLSDVQVGIPVDSTETQSNELYHWVQQARLATVKVHRDRENDRAFQDYVNPGPMQVAIKADAEEKYAVMNLIIESLRNQKQNKFSFVTGLKAE